MTGSRRALLIAGSIGRRACQIGYHGREPPRCGRHTIVTMSEAFAGGSMDSNQRPCRVAPLEAFSDDLAPDDLGAWVRWYHHLRGVPAAGRPALEPNRGGRPL